MSDTLSNFFSHLVSAQKGHILVILHPKTNLVLSFLDVLLFHGFIRGYRFSGSHLVQILLKYKNHQPAISSISRVSKSSRRFLVSSHSFSLLDSRGLFILSTSKGIMSHLTAFRLHIGGEVICHIL